MFLSVKSVLWHNQQLAFRKNAKERVIQSQRITNIFRGAYTNFEGVLVRQKAESFNEYVVDRIKEEADHLIVIKGNMEGNSVTLKIDPIAENY